jgi:hypothetical protein
LIRRREVGDVFIVPLPDGRAALGQIVGTYGKDAYYFAVFERVYTADAAPDRAREALAGPVRLLALSMDAKLHVGDWSVVGHGPVSEAVELPAYKEAVGRPGEYDVVDFSGARRRTATRGEVAALPNRKVVAPVRIEKALRASLGLEPWSEAYDELRPRNQPKTSDLFD